MTDQPNKNVEPEFNAYIANLYSRACRYEQSALELFDKAVDCKPKNIDNLYDYITNTENKTDIWALSTKCVSYPKPLDVYMIGNGNGNADKLISEIMHSMQEHKTKSYHRQLLYCAVRKDLNCIKALVKYGGKDFNINYRNKYGMTALHISVINKSGTKMINYLLERSSPNVRDSMGRTPIYYAIKTMRPEIVDVVVNKSTALDINITDSLNMSPLCYLFHQTDNIPSADFTKIETSIVTAGAKYITLHPFIDALGEKLDTVKNKIYKSIDEEMEVISTENTNLKNDIVEIATENDGLKRTIDALQRNIDDVVDKSQRHITEISECKKTIAIQEELIKSLTSKLDTTQSVAKRDVPSPYVYAAAMDQIRPTIKEMTLSSRTMFPAMHDVANPVRSTMKEPIYMQHNQQIYSPAARGFNAPSVPYSEWVSQGIQFSPRTGYVCEKN